MKKVKNEQMRAFKQIDAAIEKMSNQWVARISADMQQAIDEEPDPQMKESMEWAMGQFLDGFVEGYALGFLRLRADEE